MASRFRDAAAPLYLFACLLAGGSAQGVWQNMLLQLVGIGILAWAAASNSERPLARPARQLFILALVALAVVALQLVPLPASVWTHLGGRAQIARAFEVLGEPVPWLPVSLAPYSTLDSVFGLIPPLAMFAAITRLKAYRPSWLVAALAAGTVAGILLGLLQLSGGASWYLYPKSSFGVAIGFFANGNHMAILLVVTLPFLAALLAGAPAANRQLRSSVSAVTAALGIIILVGVALNRSLAGIGLLLPVLAASAMIVLPPHAKLRRWAGIAAAVLLVGAIGALATSSTSNYRLGSDVGESVQSRADMLKTSMRMLGDFVPLGSGLGTYRPAYQLYEPRDKITDTYVIHAHDDYLELAVELGLPGVLMLLAFLAWWGVYAARSWRLADARPYARAASIASAAILAHSLVDFPLRTAAIATVMAVCLALLNERRISTAREKNELRPARHLVIR